MTRHRSLWSNKHMHRNRCKSDNSIGNKLSTKGAQKKDEARKRMSVRMIWYKQSMPFIARQELQSHRIWFIHVLLCHWCTHRLLIVMLESLFLVTSTEAFMSSTALFHHLEQGKQPTHLFSNIFEHKTDPWRLERRISAKEMNLKEKAEKNDVNRFPAGIPAVSEDM